MFKTAAIGGYLTPTHMGDNPESRAYPPEVQETIMRANAEGFLITEDGKRVEMTKKNMTALEKAIEGNAYLKKKRKAAAIRDAQAELTGMGEGDPLDAIAAVHRESVK